MAGGADRLTVTFLGVRGSRPAPDARLSGYGGNSPCVGVALGGSRLILDAGTGIASAPEAFWHGGATHVFLTHLHHDHICGLMFYRAFYDQACEVVVHAPSGGEVFLKAYWESPYFPIPFAKAAAGARIVPVNDGDAFVVQASRPGRAGDGESLLVEAMALDGRIHPEQGVLVYRVTGGGRRVVYATDVELADEVSKRRVAAFAKDADLLILDAHFTDEEYAACAGWGHNSVSMALEVGTLAECRRLILFHHHPERPDDALRALEARVRERLAHAAFAREGAVVEIE